MLSPTTLGDTGDERYQEELHQGKNFKKNRKQYKNYFYFSIYNKLYLF